jgi:effector-binding domain-containing protein
MLTEPKLEHRDEQHYSVIRMHVPIPFGPLLGPLWAEVSAWLAKNGTGPAGPPIIRYLTTDMDKGLDIEVGFPVATPVSGDDRISAVVLPAGRYAVAVHTGPYDELVPATAELLAWAEKNGIVWQTSIKDKIEWWTGRIESYPTDPNQEPDPQKWQTELAFLIAEE